MWDPKPSDDIPPDEPFSIHVPDVSKRLNFYPLGKIIHLDKEPPSIPNGSRKRSHYIQAPLSKWPRTGEWIQDSSWLMNIWGISLTLVILPHIILRSFLHARPPISLSEGSVGQRSSFCMNSIYPLMQLF